MIKSNIFFHLLLGFGLFVGGNPKSSTSISKPLKLFNLFLRMPYVFLTGIPLLTCIIIDYIKNNLTSTTSSFSFPFFPFLLLMHSLLQLLIIHLCNNGQRWNRCLICNEKKMHKSPLLSKKVPMLSEG